MIYEWVGETSYTRAAIAVDVRKCIISQSKEECESVHRAAWVVAAAHTHNSRIQQAAYIPHSHCTSVPDIHRPSSPAVTPAVHRTPAASASDTTSTLFPCLQHFPVHVVPQPLLWLPSWVLLCTACIRSVLACHLSPLAMYMQQPGMMPPQGVVRHAAAAHPQHSSEPYQRTDVQLLLSVSVLRVSGPAGRLVRGYAQQAHLLRRRLSCTHRRSLGTPSTHCAVLTQVRGNTQEAAG